MVQQMAQRRKRRDVGKKLRGYCSDQAKQHMWSAWAGALGKEEKCLGMQGTDRGGATEHDSQVLGQVRQ